MALLDAPGIIAGAGFYAGRIQPVNYTPVDGDFCFVVGSDLPGVFNTIAEGEVAGAAQTWDLTDVNLLTFALAMRQTEALRAPHVRGLGVTYPTGFTGTEVLQVAVDDAPADAITFAAEDQSADEVAERISTGLSAGEAVVDNNQIRINSPTLGPDGRVEIVGGTALPVLGLSAQTEVGERVTFRMVVAIDTDTVFTYEPAPGPLVAFQKRTVNVKHFKGDRSIRFLLEAVQ